MLIQNKHTKKHASRFFLCVFFVNANKCRDGKSNEVSRTSRADLSAKLNIDTARGEACAQSAVCVAPRSRAVIAYRASIFMNACVIYEWRGTARVYQCQGDMCGAIIYFVTQIYVLKGRRLPKPQPIPIAPPP